MSNGRGIVRVYTAQRWHDVRTHAVWCYQPSQAGCATSVPVGGWAMLLAYHSTALHGCKFVGVFIMKRRVKDVFALEHRFG